MPGRTHAQPLGRMYEGSKGLYTWNLKTLYYYYYTFIKSHLEKFTFLPKAELPQKIHSNTHETTKACVVPMPGLVWHRKFNTCPNVKVEEEQLNSGP